MKVTLAIALLLFAIVSYVQNQTIEAQHQTIEHMKHNPACMVEPAAPTSLPNVETPRKLI